MSSSVLPIFPNSFIVSGLTFRSLIHFEFIFVCGVRMCSNFILWDITVQISQHHLLKRLSLPQCIFWAPLLKIKYPEVHGFISALYIFFHWSISLFLCQYHMVLRTVSLWYNLSQEGWFLQLHSSFSGLLWLFGVFCVSMWTVKFFVLLLWKMPLIIC